MGRHVAPTRVTTRLLHSRGQPYTRHTHTLLCTHKHTGAQPAAYAPSFGLARPKLRTAPPHAQSDGRSACPVRRAQRVPSATGIARAQSLPSPRCHAACSRHPVLQLARVHALKVELARAHVAVGARHAVGKLPHALLTGVHGPGHRRGGLRGQGGVGCGAGGRCVSSGFMEPAIGAAGCAAEGLWGVEQG
eukprot:359435-Chlamydomonas_euryale.AAC.1